MNPRANKLSSRSSAQQHNYHITLGGAKPGITNILMQLTQEIKREIMETDS